MARFSSTTRFGSLALAGLALLLPLGVIAQSPASTNLPRTWVDKDTGHRVVRLTDEPSSSGFYFNVNAYTPDEKTMVYNAPDGIHGLDLATRKTWLIVPNPAHDATDPAARRNAVHTIVVGHKTNSVFFSQYDPATKRDAIYKADVYTKAITKLAELPADAPGVATVNADETLAAGTMNDGPAVAPEYAQTLSHPPARRGLVAPQPAHRRSSTEPSPAISSSP